MNPAALRRAFRNLCLLCLAALPGPLLANSVAALPDLEIVLGSANRGHGLEAPSGGDGKNIPGATAAGVSFRRIAPGSLYFYVRITDPAYEAAAPLDLYVSADLVDDDFHRVTLQYDKAAEKPSIATEYAHALGAALLTGRGGVRTVCFHLPAARIGHGENLGADFRLCSGALAVHRIRVSPRRPKNFAPANEAGALDPAGLAALRVRRPPGMELTFGNDATDGDAAIFRALSVTSVESYVTWSSVEPDREGRWDWSKWDRQVEILRRHGLKWAPFLIAGPAYATPKWFHKSSHSHYFVCLEHGKPSKVQSIFNPDWPPYVARFLAAFAKRYADSGVIESILLGISGIYGESIYPAGPEGGWTASYTGPYHNHYGWWAGDPYAVADFRHAMRRRYWFLSRLNHAWSARYRHWREVRTFLPQNAPNDRARADMAQWYERAMTRWAAFWVRTARRYFPHTEIYLCTGGDGAPLLGADFTAQAKAISPWRAGIRITNEASDFAANFTVTREVSTATRLYGTFAGFEPAGRVDPQGVVARIFNAVASGARQLHYYTPNILQSGEALRNFRRNIGYLVPRRPRIAIAFYVSRETWEVDSSALPRMYACARSLRDLADYDMVTRTSVRDGALRGRRALILVHSPVLEPGAAARIRRWVRRGGVLIAATHAGELPGTRLYDLRSWRKDLFVANPPQAGAIVRRTLGGPAPEAWRLELGTPADEDWIFGDWYGPERGLEWPGIPGARKRWSGARPGILLPVKPGAPYTLRLEAHLSEFSLAPGANTVRVNGFAVGRLDKPGNAVYTFRVPAEAVGRDSLARLEFEMNTWVPKEHGGGSDARKLGVALHAVAWTRAGAAASPKPARIRWGVDPRAFRRAVRRVGKGWTVLLPDLAANPQGLARVLAPLLRNTADFLPGVRPLAPEDGRLDGVYAARTNTGILRYSPASATIRAQP